MTTGIQSTTGAVKTMSGAELLAELDRLRAENAILATKAASSHASSLSMKVSEKGALSVYGLGRFPVTLYVSQWERLIAKVADIQEFVKAHASTLTRKE